jgi:glutathione S-transferase
VELIGMLDSPYVRRVAISLQLLGLRFEHRSVSVFRTFDEFRRINPVVKAPTLICDDGTLLMDSTLILDYAEHLAAPGRSLMPAATEARLVALRAIGLALAACEKSVQIIYERELRPAEKQHAPWVIRVTNQLAAAYRALDQAIGSYPGDHKAPDQALITSAVAWTFTQALLPDVVRADDYPRLRDLAAAAETLPAFTAAPHGDSVYRAATP